MKPSLNVYISLCWWLDKESERLTKAIRRIRNIILCSSFEFLNYLKIGLLNKALNDLDSDFELIALN